MAMTPVMGLSRCCGGDISTPQKYRLPGIICRRLQITVDLGG
jgi:hypothetical protein